MRTFPDRCLGKQAKLQIYQTQQHSVAAVLPQKCHFCIRKDAYTCWSQASGARVNNWGTRIDLILAADRAKVYILASHASHFFLLTGPTLSAIIAELSTQLQQTGPPFQSGLLLLFLPGTLPLACDTQQKTSLRPSPLLLPQWLSISNPN